MFRPMQPVVRRRQQRRQRPLLRPLVKATIRAQRGSEPMMGRRAVFSVLILSSSSSSSSSSSLLFSHAWTAQ